MRSLLVFDTAAGTPVASTGTEGSVARLLLTTPMLAPGALLGFECVVRATATVGADTWQIRVRLGTSSTVTSNTAIATGTATDAVNNDLVTVRGTIHLHSATRAVVVVRMDNPPAATGVPNAETWTVIHTLTADTATYLDVTVDWSTANANSAQSEAWAVWRVQ